MPRHQDHAVIAKSDLIILVVSSSLLAVAIYRWDQNTRDVDTSTVLANTRVIAPAETTDVANTALSTTSVAAVNSDDTQLNAGTQVVPEATDVTTAVVTPTPTVEAAPARTYDTYIVKSGDSLSKIANQYNTTVSTLRDLNGITGSTIFIGQEILYPNN